MARSAKKRTRADVYWWYVARDYDPMYATWKADEWERKMQEEGKSAGSGKKAAIKRQKISGGVG
jgi:hypothetical protein